MTVASEITKAQTNLANSYTACQNKGATLPTAQNFDNLPATINTITGGGGSTGKYKLLDRVKTDSNVEIGTVSGFFTDANDVEYAVVCLDAQYRTTRQWCSNSSTLVTNLPAYSNLKTSNVWESKETATFNTQKILDFCSAKGYTSQACTHCRSNSFTIGGITYYGQLPNMIELIDIGKRYNAIEAKDITSSSYTSANFASARNIWASNQVDASSAYYLYIGNYATYQTKTNTARFAVPVLEIPNAV